MYLEVIMWNTDDLEGTGQDLRMTIQKYETGVIAVSELK